MIIGPIIEMIMSMPILRNYSYIHYLVWHVYLLYQVNMSYLYCIYIQGSLTKSMCGCPGYKPLDPWIKWCIPCFPLAQPELSFSDHISICRLWRERCAFTMRDPTCRTSEGWDVTGRHGVRAETANHRVADDATHWVAFTVLIRLMCQALNYTSGGFYCGMFSTTDPGKPAAVSRRMLSGVEASLMR